MGVRVLSEHASSASDTKPVTILFAGDIMLSREVGRQIALHKDPDFPFVHIADMLHSADIVFGNLETPISTRGENRGSIYSFRSDPAVVPGLARAGVTVVSIANNHIFDWGPRALADTVDALTAQNIHPIGAGTNETAANAPYVANIHETTIGFLAYTTLYPRSLEAHGDFGGVSVSDETAMKKAVMLLKKHADIVVVSLHWGVEYNQHATIEQRRIAHELVDAGANLVIGHHPHVVEEVEKYHGGWIAYSLGNFVFDQTFSFPTTHGLLARATIHDTKVIAFDLLPIVINSAYQPELVASSTEQ